MSTVQSPELTFDSQPFFSAHWLGCHPYDQQPRLVWVDFPLQDPRAELAVVGLQHVWTGIALVRTG